MEFGTWDRLLWLTTTTLSAAIIVRLGTLRILFTQPYQAFAVMLGVGLTREAVLWPLSYDPAVYAQAWEASLIVLLGAQIVAAISAYDFLARRRTREFSAALSAALALAVLPLVIEDKTLFSQNELLRMVLLLYRWVDGGLAVLLIAAAIQSTRKVQPHTWLLIGYFGSYFAVCLVKNTLPLQVPMLDRIHLLAVAALYACWLVLPLGAKQTKTRSGYHRLSNLAFCKTQRISPISISRSPTRF